MFTSLFQLHHPATLGHEVIGNQLAYHYSGVLLEALQLLQNGAVECGSDGKQEIDCLRELAKMEPLPALPEPIACTPQFCSHEFTCALGAEPTFNPNSETPADWKINANATYTDHGKWPLRLGPDQSGQPATPPYHFPSTSGREQPVAEACGGDRADSQAPCFNSFEFHSMRDHKFGLRGGASDGTLLLQLPSTKMKQCLVMLADVRIGPGVKPLPLANWQEEAIITVNGRVCGEACQVHTEAGAQLVVVDVRQLLGDECNTADPTLGIRVVPLNVSQPAAVGGGGFCVWSTRWKCCMPRGGEGGWDEFDQAKHCPPEPPCPANNRCCNTPHRPVEDVALYLGTVLVS